MLRSRRLRLVALALLLPALALRALIPVGFMPASGANSVLALQMCSVGTFGAAESPRIERDSLLRAFDPAERTPLGHDEDRGTPCDFAPVSSGAALPPAPAAVVLATLGREPRPQPVADLIPVFSLTERAQQPRAPPTYS
jgi:hypothetical protein